MENSNPKTLSDFELETEVKDLLKEIESDPEDKKSQKRLEALYRERSLRQVDYSI